MQKILIAGGTGTVGRQLTQLLIANGYGVHILTRNIAKYQQTDTTSYYSWDAAAGKYDVNALHDVVAVVNLAGEGIADKRWTAARKKAIADSRVQAGNTLTHMLLNNKHTVQHLVQASAIGWYAPSTTDTLPYTEDAPAYNDYLATTCALWENSISALRHTNMSISTLRIGIVLSNTGGMAKELMLPIKMHVAPTFGNGKQIVPWIHIQDLAGTMLYAIQNKLNGTYNAVASYTDSQKTVTKAIAKINKKSIWLTLPIPAFVLKIMLGGMSIELLKSSRISNEKIKKAGYKFMYPALENIDQL
jgi:uncharacterized protein